MAKKCKPHPAYPFRGYVNSSGKSLNGVHLALWPELASAPPGQRIPALIGYAVRVLQDFPDDVDIAQAINDLPRHASESEDRLVAAAATIIERIMLLHLDESTGKRMRTGKAEKRDTRPEEQFACKVIKEELDARIKRYGYSGSPRKEATQIDEPVNKRLRKKGYKTFTVRQIANRISKRSPL